jgi:hypothetical protein
MLNNNRRKTMIPSNNNIEYIESQALKCHKRIVLRAVKVFQKVITIYLFIYLFIYISIYPSIYVSIYLSNHLSIHPSTYRYLDVL